MLRPPMGRRAHCRGRGWRLLSPREFRQVGERAGEEVRVVGLAFVEIGADHRADRFLHNQSKEFLAGQNPSVGRRPTPDVALRGAP